MLFTIDGAKRGNLALTALLLVTILFTAFHEGYLPLISLLFWVVLLVGVCMCVWLALTIPTRRLLALVLGIFLIEYVKESIGIRSKLWSYHGTNTFFNFGGWSWVLGGVSVYALSTKVVIRQLARIRVAPPRWVNPVLVVLVSSLIFLTLGEYWSGVGVLFIVLYSILIVAALFVSTKMDFYVLAGLVVTSWVVGNLGEYAGSVDSGCWTYTYDPDYPPVFLLFGCWPLEIIAQYAFSAFVAREPLDAHITSTDRREERG
jgi:hypothetical protein